jgi:hypothetical protein
MEPFNYNGITVQRIKEHSFMMNESSIKKDEVFQSEILFYHYINDSNKLVDIVVQNIFTIPDLSKYAFDTAVKLPTILITSLVGMSVSHTRALLSKNISGSALNDANLSLIIPEDVARHFFAFMFEDNLKIKEEKVLD